MKRRSRTLLLAGLALAVAFTVRAGLDGPPEVPYENKPYNGRFTFPRLRFNPIWWGFGPHYWGLDLKWNHDYPRGESHLMKIMAELTTLEVNQGGGNIYRLDDPELFKYPWAYICETGFWNPTDKEAAALRAYLLKGGFLVVDDILDPYPYGRQWQNFVAGMRRVLPEGQLIQLDASHPIFDSFFHLEKLDFKHPNFPELVNPVYYGIFQDNDPAKRLMVVVNYNNDIGEFWEWSDQGFFPIELTNDAYKLGVNYIIYGMTH